MLTLLLGTALTAAAQKDSIVSYSIEHPLVYEDAWDLWPYAFLNEQGEPEGYNVDLVKMIFKALDIPYIIKLKPTNEAFADIKSGKADITLGMDANFHQEYGYFSKSVVQLFTHSVVHRKGTKAPISTIADLANYRVCVHDGSYSHHLMQDHGWGDNAIPYEDMKEAIHKAMSEPDTYILWNTMSLKWLIRKYQADNLELSSVDIPHGEYKFISGNRHLLQQVDSIYSKLRADEKLQPIQNKWFYPEKTLQPGLPSWVRIVAFALAAVALGSVLLYISYRLREKKMTADVQKKNARLAMILQTSHVRFFTYNVKQKVFTQMDMQGNTEHTYTIPEFMQLFYNHNFEILTEAINRIVRQEEQRVTVEIQAKPLRSQDEYNDYLVALAVLHRDDQGRPDTIIGTRSDITEERIKQRQTKDTMLRYQAIFNTAMVDMVYYDEVGHIQDINQKACETFGVDHDELVTNKVTLSDVLGLDHSKVFNGDIFYATQLLNLHPGEHRSSKVSKRRRERMFYEIQIVPVYGVQHQLLGYYGTGVDMTEVADSFSRRQENIRQMQKANQELTNYIANINYALRVGHIKIARYSAITHTLTIYSEIGHEEYALTQARAMKLAHEESKKTAERILNSMDNSTIMPIDADIRTTLRVKGKPLCLQLHFVPIVGDDGLVKEYLGTCRDTSELKATEAELQKETVRAQEVEGVKNAFLRNMSYEIRTPLNTVVGFAELFQQEHSSDDEQVFIEEIKDSSRHLLNLINNILFLSRLDARMIDIKPRMTDYAPIFESQCEAGWAGLQQEGVSYLVENPFEQLNIEIDDQNMGIILEQVLKNACQHTRSGSVRVRADYIGRQFVVTVVDTGDGIDKEFLDNIFERFATGGNKGTGLGLSICYELLQQMGGNIQISSRRGRGTTVWITLPCETGEIVRK